MKKILYSLIAASCLYASNGSLEEVKNEIESLPGLKNFNTKIEQIKEIDKNWYAIKVIQETQQGKRSFDAFSNKKLFIIGNGFDLENGKTINIQTDFTKFKEKASYTIGNGKEEYFLITDPECPFCVSLEKILPLLKDKVKIHVFLTGDIIPAHLASKGIINYIESLPKDKRAAESRAIFLETNKANVLKKIDKYNPSMYQMMLSYKNNPDARPIIDSYVKELEVAFNVKLDNEAALEKFLTEKIASTKITPAIEKSVQEKRDIISMYFKANGTPSVYKADGQKLRDQFELFDGVVNMEKIKEMASNKELSITAGKIGAKKAYYFIGTQCAGCKEHYSDKNGLKKLLDNYEVHFLLALNGSNPTKAQKELLYLYSLADETTKYKLLDSIMNGKELSFDELNKQYSNEYMQKIGKYLNNDMMETLVDYTPAVYDENGKNIR